MHAHQIKKLNEGIVVMRHFIQLSAQLLPVLHKLSRAKNPSSVEVENRLKIIDVYKSYTFDHNISRILMNSDVLVKIESCFKSTISKRETSYQKRRKLKDFLREYKRLNQNWQLIESN